MAPKRAEIAALRDRFLGKGQRVTSLLDIEVGDPALAAGVLAAIGRACAMLTGLIHHCRR